MKQRTGETTIYLYVNEDLVGSATLPSLKVGTAADTINGGSGFGSGGGRERGQDSGECFVLRPPTPTLTITYYVLLISPSLAHFTATPYYYYQPPEKYNNYKNQNYTCNFHNVFATYIRFASYVLFWSNGRVSPAGYMELRPHTYAK